RGSDRRRPHDVRGGVPRAWRGARGPTPCREWGSSRASRGSRGACVGSPGDRRASRARGSDRPKRGACSPWPRSKIGRSRRNAEPRGREARLRRGSPEDEASAPSGWKWSPAPLRVACAPMFGRAFGEILIIRVVALLVLGPERLPKVARSVGKGLRDLRRTTGSIREIIEDELYLDEVAERRPAAKDASAQGEPVPRGPIHAAPL